MDFLTESNTIQDFKHGLYQLLTKGIISIQLWKLGTYNETKNYLPYILGNQNKLEKVLKKIKQSRICSVTIWSCKLAAFYMKIEETFTDTF